MTEGTKRRGRPKNSEFKEERVKPNPEKGKKMPTYHAVIDLLSFPCAETVLDFECNDGERRHGVFIPYEINNIYVSEKHAYINLHVLARSMEQRRKAVGGINQTHEMRPYWTKEQTQKMHKLGYFKKLMVHGWLKIMSYVSWGTEMEREKK